MTVKEIVNQLEVLSNPAIAESWDNVGLQIGSLDKEVACVYIALDATDEVIEAAIGAKADLLLTHHPMIFKGMKQIRDDHFIGKRAIQMIQQDMAYYAMHTNFDITCMAEAAAKQLAMGNCEVLQATCEIAGTPEGFGRVGTLPKSMTLKECALYVKEKFGISMVTVFGDANQTIEKVAICPGSGGSLFGDARKAGVDAYITGDIDHHEGIDAVAQGVAIIDAGHYGIEQIFVPYMTNYLQTQFPNLHIVAAQSKEPCWFI